ncbi:hypothetical protein BJX76DRAFT_366114 [Aspergillus varians]
MDQFAPGSNSCCLALSSLLDNKVHFPSTEPYNASVSSYFSQQNSNLHPLCIVSPTTKEDVSTIINSITESKSQCPFAVRSGGHISFGGAANINQGITIDLSSLNSMTLSDDRSTLSVGVGATWGEVYAFLDPLNLSVAGGRAAQVGVGGLTLGGGISYLSPRYGWTCDTATAFEVVLADKTIVEATRHENPDLLSALRGGGSNLGIVTKINLRAFEQGPIWGGSVYYSIDTADSQITAFAEMNSADRYDEFASLITSFGFAGAGTGSAVVNSIVYTQATEHPSTFEKFFDMPILESSMRIARMHEMSEEQGSFSVDGRREMSVVMTQKSTVPMLNATYLRWNSSLAAVEDITGINWSISLEPLPPSIYARAAAKNALGLSDATDALVVVLLSATWDDEKDDARVEHAARVLFDGMEEDSQKLDSYEPFLYMNYAAQWQDPIASYGRGSVERLRRVARGVDPDAVFRVKMPGGFKIPY